MAAFGSKLMRLGRLFMITVVPVAALVIGVLIIWKVTSKEGKIVWTFKPEKDRPFSAVLSAEDCVIAACDNASVYGLDKNTGQALWGFDGKRGIAQRPPIQVGDLCIASDYEFLYGVNSKNGKRVWKHAFPQGQQPEAMVGSKYIAYLYQTMRELTPEEKRKIIGPILSNQVTDASALCVIRLDDGSELWRKTFKKTFFAGGELAVGNEVIYYGTHTTEGDLEEKDGDMGKTPPKKADAKPKAGPKTEPKEPPKKPPTDEEPLDVPELTTKFIITAYDAMSERGRWKAVLEGGSGYSVNMQSTPIGVLVTTSSNVYLLAEADGKLLWKHSIEKIEFLFWNPQIKGDLIFVPGNNMLSCLDLNTGKVLWQYKSNDESDPGQPEVEGDTVFLTSYVQEERKTGMSGEGPGLPTYRGTEELVKEFQKEMPAQQKTVAVSELLALDAKTGQPRWRMRDVGSKLILGNGILVALRYHTFATTTETRITAVQTATGNKLWESTYIGKVMEGWTDGQRFYMAANSGVDHSTMSSPQPPRDNIVGAYSIGR